MVTVAVRRVPLDRSSESFPITSIRRLAIIPTLRVATAPRRKFAPRVSGTRKPSDRLIKLEVIGDQTTLFRITSKPWKPPCPGS